jgi:hypothetical protein
MYGIKFSQNTLLCPWLAEVNIDIHKLPLTDHSPSGHRNHEVSEEARYVTSFGKVQIAIPTETWLPLIAVCMLPSSDTALNYFQLPISCIRHTHTHTHTHG